MLLFILDVALHFDSTVHTIAWNFDCQNQNVKCLHLLTPILIFNNRTYNVFQTYIENVDSAKERIPVCVGGLVLYREYWRSGGEGCRSLG